MASLRGLLEDLIDGELEDLRAKPKDYLNSMGITPPPKFDYDEFVNAVYDKDGEIIDAVEAAIRNKSKNMWLPDEDLAELLLYELSGYEPRLSRNIDAWEQLAEDIYNAYSDTLANEIARVYSKVLRQNRRLRST